MDWIKEANEAREEQLRRDDVDKGKALEALAVSMQKTMSTPIEDISTRCMGEASKWCLEVSTWAKSCGDEVYKGFGVERLLMDVKWDSSDPERVVGRAGVDVGRLTRMREFRAPASEAPKVAARAALRALMEGHSWLSEGFEMGSTDDMSLEAAKVREFLLGLPSLGESGACLADLVETETMWNHERWRSSMWLEDMSKLAAEKGLLPSGFANSRMRLSDGWPGEPTLLVEWDVRQVASFSGYGRGGDDALKSRPERGWEADEGQWALPSLDEGKEALWVAFAAKAAQAQASGWSSMPSNFSSSQAMASCRAAMESLVIGATSMAPAAQKAQAKSL